MRPKALLLALCLLMLSACSTPPAHAPSVIPPPPVALASACPVPDTLSGNVSAQDIIGWTMEWINAFACERGKRAALLDSWPR